MAICSNASVSFVAWNVAAASASPRCELLESVFNVYLVCATAGARPNEEQQ